MRVVARPQGNGGADGDCEAVLEQFAQAGVDVDAFGCPPAGRGREIDCEIVERINGRDRVQERRAQTGRLRINHNDSNAGTGYFEFLAEHSGASYVLREHQSNPDREMWFLMEERASDQRAKPAPAECPTSSRP